MKDKDYENTLIEFKGKKISYGRYLFNKCFPDTFPLIDRTIDKTVLEVVLNELSLNYPSSIVMETLDNIKDLGFYYSTIEGATLGIDDLYSKRLLEIANSMKNNTINENLDIMKTDKEILEITRNMKFAEFINSGSRGSWDQALQLIVARGYVADANNNVLDNFISSSYIKGLNQKEFFSSAWGTRKGLMDTALSTGASGYLTRQLIYSTVNIELGTEDDCGTTEYLPIKIAIYDDDKKLNIKKSETFAKSLLWRFYIENNKNKLITKQNYKSIIGKTINLRSPIYCKNKKICKKCYGNLSEILHSDQIGIVATQSVSERITQKVLRTFHISGAVHTAKTDSSENSDIISGINIANKLFHSPKDIKNIKTPSDLVSLIYDIFGEGTSVHLIHFEILVSAMMWIGRTPWRLHKNRSKVLHEWVSILKVPNRISWLLGCAFSNVKSKILEGLIENRTDNPSALSALFKL